MHLLHIVFEWLEIIIDVSAAIVMVFAFAGAMVSYVQIAFRAERPERIRKLQIVRCDLGVKLVFSLELLIISDLLVTIVSRSLDDMILVGVLVLIRTVIAYFLNKEIEEVSAGISR